MIRVIIEVDLVFPYKISMGVLAEFCSLWNCTLLAGGTQKLKAIISMPGIFFKRIFGTNPREKEYTVPQGMEYFISRLIVKDILIKENK